MDMTPPAGWPAELEDEREIATFVEDVSSEEVDTELIEDMYRGCSARLVFIPIGDLQAGDADHNIPSKSKEKRYLKMDPTTMPPLLIEEDGTVADGNHRLRVAIKLGLPGVWCYKINEN